jgi:hypothetical protein
MKTKGTKPHKEDVQQASKIVVVSSVTGLTVCFVAAKYYKADVPLIMYAIFGGGILGTDNILKLLKSIFRIGNDR